MSTKLLLCDCAGSMPLDVESIGSACDVECSKVHTALCTRELDAAAAAIQQGDTIIACGQEQEVFQALAEDLSLDAPGFVDLRDRAGWSEQGADATPKMAALTAEALLPQPVTPGVDVYSEGTCLIIGPGDVAFALAERLSGSLALTVLVTDAAEPLSRAFDVCARADQITSRRFGWVHFAA